MTTTTMTPTATTTLTVADLLTYCRAHGACGDVRDWLATLDPSAAAETAWRECADAWRLAWLAACAAPPALRRGLLDIAEAEALPHAGALRDFAAEAIRVARLCLDGKATEAEVRAAVRAADAVMATSADSFAAYAATYAAYAAATYSAAAYAISTTSAAAYTAKAVATITGKTPADLVRQYVPWQAVESGILAADSRNR